MIFVIKCRKNPLVAPPLKRSDCSMISDGAAALIIADDELALEAERQLVLRPSSNE